MEEIVVHCTSQEEFNACLKYAENIKYQWMSVDTPLNGRDYFKAYRSNTGLFFTDGYLAYSPIEFFKEEGYNTCTFSEFSEKYLTK